MSTKHQSRYDLSLLDDLFGRAPLLKGEDRKKFKGLEAAVSEALCPEDLFDAIDAREITSAIWDAQLYQKMFQKLVDSKRKKAFEILTSERFGHVSEEQEDWIESLGAAPYPDGMTEAEVLKKVGLSLELLQAQAVLMAQEDIPHLERLIANRVAARKARLKDYERRKRTRAKSNLADDDDDEEVQEPKGLGKRRKESS